ncbi:MAG: DUF3179 domain-containing protein [Nitrospinota bacterium]|nr:MAG: DUF3179 domain-containing protein [Nitrospinota bacterium]
MVYAREYGGETLTFGVSGKLYANSLIMYDHQTGSLWSHLTGEAITGAKRGTRLRVLPAMQTTWKLWRALHPETLVIAKSRSPYLRDYSRDPYEGYYYSSRTGVIPPLRRDQRLNPKEYIIGVRIAGKAKAYPFSLLNTHPVINDSFQGTPLLVVFSRESATGMVFRRTLAGKVLTFSLAGEGKGEVILLRDAETGSLWSGLTGTAQQGPLQGKSLIPLPLTYAFWFGWKDFYPDTVIWEAPR